VFLEWDGADDAHPGMKNRACNRLGCGSSSGAEYRKLADACQTKVRLEGEDERQDGENDEYSDQLFFRASGARKGAIRTGGNG
jgi:hypothetical protein